jgi:hypothetical protein
MSSTDILLVLSCDCFEEKTLWRVREFSYLIIQVATSISQESIRSYHYTLRQLKLISFSKD